MNQNSKFIQEIERGLYGRLYAWEGKPEEVYDFGEVVVHTQPAFAVAHCFQFEQVEPRLEEIITQVEERVRQRCFWIIGPSTYPADLGEQFVARGYSVKSVLEGLVLEDLTTFVPSSNPELVIEPLSMENVEAYATAASPPSNAAAREEELGYALRYLQFPHKEILIFVAFLHGEPAGYSLMRLESGGVANLCDAYTQLAARHQGVYLAMVAHRLSVAREQGCTLAITRANSQTSAPILLKRGFTRVCHFTLYIRSS